MSRLVATVLLPSSGGVAEAASLRRQPQHRQPARNSTSRHTDRFRQTPAPALGGPGMRRGNVLGQVSPGHLRRERSQPRQPDRALAEQFDGGHNKESPLVTVGGVAVIGRAGVQREDVHVTCGQGAHSEDRPGWPEFAPPCLAQPGGLDFYPHPGVGEEGRTAPTQSARG